MPCPQNLRNHLSFAINALKITFEKNLQPQRCSTFITPSLEKLLQGVLWEQKSDCSQIQWTQCQNHYPCEPNIPNYHSITVIDWSPSFRKPLTLSFPLSFVPPSEFMLISFVNFSGLSFQPLVLVPFPLTLGVPEELSISSAGGIIHCSLTPTGF